ncbi:spaetzle-processing enzyme-like isoform X1 [Drosophila montana]|uniref:spaetzle-processing enzyme-like isoform X1 n=1 Tax=Drosophila montana TaxID=40370 RepID=UPI00313EC959
MFKLKVRGLAIFCAILALVYAGSRPLRHYGRCNVYDEIGYCQPRQLCWETDVNFNSSSRSHCQSQMRSDLVCCRRMPTAYAALTLKPLLPQPGVCGGIGIDIANRIVAGTDTHITDFPWMALLFATNDGEEYRQICGGSLIHERWILTAGHCAFSRDGSQLFLKARLGEWNTTSAPDCQQFKNERICAPQHIDVNVDRIIVHKQYVGPLDPNYANDIALLRLNRTVSFSEFVLPICLPVANFNDEYTYADWAMDIAGWGNTERIRSGGSPVKMRAELNVLSMASCRQIHPHVMSGQMCAGGSTPSGTCHGDSGGPLMMQDPIGSENSRYYLAGIVSIGTVSCNNHGQPMLFTRVEYYMPWVINTISANS